MKMTSGRASRRYSSADSADSIEQWRIAYIGSKGALKSANAGIKSIEDKGERVASFKKFNEVQTALKSAFEQRKADGIPLDDGTWTALAESAETLGVSLPAIE